MSLVIATPQPASAGVPAVAVAGTSPASTAQISTARISTARISAGPARGMLLAASAISLFAIMNALVKWLAADYSVPQLLFFRSLFAFVPIGIFLWRSGGVSRLKTRHPGLHLLRGTIGIAATCGFFYAFAKLPLAEATSIGFAIPLFVTALSVPMLGEHVGWRRTIAVLVGLVGVLVVLRPGAVAFEPAAAIALAAAFGAAATMLMSRRLSRTDHSAAIAFHYSLFAVLASGLMLPFAWVTPSLVDLALFACVGLVGGGGLILITEAYARAPAAVIAPFEYVHILWATGLGLFVWGTIPGWNVALGAAIVIASGLYILHRETRLGVARGAAAKAQAHPSR